MDNEEKIKEMEQQISNLENSKLIPLQDNGFYTLRNLK